MKKQIHASRWKARLGASLAIILGFLVFFPATVCGYHFNPEAVVVTLVPVVWGIYALVTYNDLKEQIVGWLSFVFAMLCVWLGVTENLIFVFV